MLICSFLKMASGNQALFRPHGGLLVVMVWAERCPEPGPPLSSVTSPREPSSTGLPEGNLTSSVPWKPLFVLGTEHALRTGLPTPW